MDKSMNLNLNVTKNKQYKLINVSNEQEVQIFAKQMLIKRLFVGHYQERRFVYALNTYRDIIRVSESENDLQHDLKIVKKRIQQVYSSPKIWIGITEPEMIGAPAGVCVWVKLNNIPFGYHWFQIREIKFDDNQEVFVRVKYMRSIENQEVSALPINPRNVPKDTTAISELPQDASTSNLNSDEIVPSFDSRQLVSLFRDIKYKELLFSVLFGFSDMFTRNNIRQVISFLVVLTLSIFKFVTHLGDFTLKVMREITLFVQVCTPIFLGIIDFFSKCFGGILILISVIWRSSSNNTQQNFKPQKPPLAITYGSYRSNEPTYRQRRYNPVN